MGTGYLDGGLLCDIVLLLHYRKGRSKMVGNNFASFLHMLCRQKVALIRCFDVVVGTGYASARRKQ